MEVVEDIRIATVTLYVIRKRCRKEEFEVVQGYGSNDEEAISDLQNNFDIQKRKWKSYKIIKAITYDGKRFNRLGYYSIQESLMPNQKDNVKALDFEEKQP